MLSLMFSRNLTSKISLPVVQNLKTTIAKQFSVEIEYKKEIEDINAMRKYRNERKGAMVGIITSVKCPKTLTVRVQHDRYISKYNKYLSVHKNFLVHDPDCKGRLGDTVRVIPCIRKSKRKHHELKDVINRLQSFRDGMPEIFHHKSPEAVAVQERIEETANMYNF